MELEQKIAQKNILLAFSNVFSSSIYPIYKEHEESFDKDGIHGVLHIARSIVASFILSIKCKELGMKTNTTDILIATAFHDSGRKANGNDYWEGASSENCLAFITKNNFMLKSQLTNNTPDMVSKMIVKRCVNDFEDAFKKYENPIDFMCVYDSDCLEIMRECCGRGGRNSFIKEKLLLYNYNYDFYIYYGQLINEWWSFICATENIKPELSTPDCLNKLIQLIEMNPEQYPLIYEAII